MMQSPAPGEAELVDQNRKGTDLLESTLWNHCEWPTRAAPLAATLLALAQLRNNDALFDGAAKVA